MYRALSTTRIRASAVLKGLPNVNRTTFDVKLNDFNTTRTDINKVGWISRWYDYPRV